MPSIIRADRMMDITSIILWEGSGTMPVPKRKTIRANRDSRRANIKMTVSPLVPLEGQKGVKVPRRLVRAYKEGLLTPEKR